MLVFALAFTISCSGEDGKNGKNGDSCTLKQQEGGDAWDILCGGEIVGNPIKSGNGKDGDDGERGPKGDDCSLTPKGNTFEITCAGQLKGTLEGCRTMIISQANKEYSINCGGSDISLCGGQSFDPLEKVCQGGALSTAVPQACGTTTYFSSKQYCGYGPNDTINGTPGTVYTYCNNDNTKKPNSTYPFADEYCQFTGPTTAKVAGTAVGDYCNGKPINKDAWKYEYCGWPSLESATKDVLTGLCDLPLDASATALTALETSGPSLTNPQGPNQASFGQGYCVATRSSLKTQYTERFCGSSANNKPNNGEWKNEYCGFAEGNDDVRTVVYKGYCDDTDFSKPVDASGYSTGISAPHFKGYNYGYCGVTYANREKNTTTLITTFCGDDPTKKPNEGSWKGQYCGYGSATSTDDDKVYESGICDDGKGPNQGEWNPDHYCQAQQIINTSTTPPTLTVKTVRSEFTCDNGDKINVGTYQKQYCGYAKPDADETSKLTGACDIGGTPGNPKGPFTLAPEVANKSEWYCQVQPPLSNPLGLSTYTKEACTSPAKEKINDGSWKKEYCGYNAGTPKPSVTVRKTNGCDDGKGPDFEESGKGFCTFKNKDSKYSEYSDQKCGTSTQINATKWENQYCFLGDNVVARCGGGLTAVTSAPSTAAGNCVTPSVFGLCQKDGAEYKYAAWAKDVKCELASGSTGVCPSSTHGTKDANEYVKTCVVTYTLEGEFAPAAAASDPTPDNATPGKSLGNDNKLWSKALCTAAGGEWNFTDANEDGVADDGDYKCTFSTTKGNAILSNTCVTPDGTKPSIAGKDANGTGTTPSTDKWSVDVAEGSAADEFICRWTPVAVTAAKAARK